MRLCCLAHRPSLEPSLFAPDLALALPRPAPRKHSQQPQVVEGAVVLAEPRPLFILEVLDVLHHLREEESD